MVPTPSLFLHGVPNVKGFPGSRHGTSGWRHSWEPPGCGLQSNWSRTTLARIHRKPTPAARGVNINAITHNTNHTKRRPPPLRRQVPRGSRPQMHVHLWRHFSRQTLSRLQGSLGPRPCKPYCKKEPRDASLVPIYADIPISPREDEVRQRVTPP